ncbi:MAG: type II secretion system protein GspH [Legionella sp.]|nr:MAG: type II secretion system protein GspH [Legionella sp.]
MNAQFPTRQNGFTLIEILVVVLIISITLGFAMMAFGDFGAHRKIRSAAEGFSQFAELVHERALLESSTLKLQLNSTGYYVQRLSPNHQWQALQSSMYHLHPLPSNTFLSVSAGSSRPDQLIIIMSATGDMTPFKVYFGSPAQPRLASVVGKENGTILFQKEGTS